MSGSTLFSTVRRDVRRRVPGLVVVSALLNMLLLVTAIYMLQVYDRVLASGSMDTLIWLSVIAIFAILTYGVLENVRRVTLGRMGSWIDRELTETVLRSRMNSRLAGTPVHAGPRDVADYRAFFQSDAALSLLDVPWSLVFIAFIWALHPALGMIALCGGIVLFGLTVLNDALTRRERGEAAQRRRSINEHAIRYLEKGETIRPLGMTNRIFSKWQKAASDAGEAEQAATEQTVRILSLSKSIRQGLQIVILGIGAFLVLQGQITPGAMIAASIILGRALGPIERVTAAWRRLAAARTASRALSAQFAQIDESESLSLPAPAGSISADGAYYTPPGAREPILRDINFSLEPGDCAAIIGPSGSGKSSLCKLLVGAWAPSAGNVRIDGADAFNWNPEELGPHIGYLPQRVEFFPGTVADNIARFSDAADVDIVAASKAAGVHELVLGLPKGYETDMDPTGSTISLGQRQRIGLARALFGSPSILVLDEPNSNMDRAGDAALHTAIETQKAAGKTVVIVSHRASILKFADTVISMREGRIFKVGGVEDFVKPVRKVQEATG